MLLEILDLINEETLNYIVLAFNIFLLIVLTTSLVFVRDSRKRWNKVSDYLGDLTKTVDSVRYGDLTKKINSLLKIITKCTMIYDFIPSIER